MKAFIFGIVTSVIIIAGLLIIGSEPKELTESEHEGFVESVEFVEFQEPLEIYIPVQHFDFSDEDPMVITAQPK